MLIPCYLVDYSYICHAELLHYVLLFNLYSMSNSNFYDASTLNAVESLRASVRLLVSLARDLDKQSLDLVRGYCLSTFEGRDRVFVLFASLMRLSSVSDSIVANSSLFREL